MLFNSLRPEGLFYEEDFLSQDESINLVKLVDQQAWSHELGRRTQQYGFTYNYSTGRVIHKNSATLIPDFLQAIAIRLREAHLMSSTPNQVIVNEYIVNEFEVQGIAPHIDRIDDFGPEIVTLSLVEEWCMRFKKEGHDAIEVPLAVGSVAVMTGPSRFEWDHSIPARKYDRIQGLRRQRHRRVSLTFRLVLPNRHQKENND